MLWAKESKNHDALYVDILNVVDKSDFHLNAINEYIFGSRRSAPKKSETIALLKRNEGNKFFATRDWESAMEMYNECLCYAEPGSKQISLAYANRSACFLHMKHYNECLVDIELAKASGYPSNMMSKIYQRKEECLKYIEEDAEQKVGPKLSYAPHKNIPFMADILQIDRDINGEYSIVATEDIDIGQTVAFEKSFSKYLYTRHGWKCNICLARNTNLIACTKCTGAMFCRDKCTNHFLHEYECGNKFHFDYGYNGLLMKDIRSVLQAIEMFSNVDDLMKFVEDVIKSNIKKLPEKLTDFASQYETFLKLRLNKTFITNDFFEATTSYMYKFLLDIPKINMKFHSKKHRRFLMHLLVQHVEISNSNARNLSVAMPGGLHSKSFYSYIGLMHRYFTSSCTPNLVNFDYDADMMYITCRLVKKGDKLCMSPHWPLDYDKKLRAQMLLEFYNGMVCDCERCIGPAIYPSQKVVREMQRDRDYQYVKMNYSQFNTRMDRDAGIIEKCTAFLKKYGDMPWCQEISDVVNAYKFTLATIIAGTVPPRYIEFD